QSAVGQAAGVQHGGVHGGQVQLIGDGLQVQQGAAGAVGVDVGLVHLQHVGHGAAGGLGGELVPVGRPFRVLGGDGRLLVGLGEQLERVAGHGVAQVPAPPVDPDGAAVAPAAAGAAARVGAAGGEGGQGAGCGEQGEGS